MDILREKLENYKDATLHLISCLEAEKYDMLDELIDKRKCIICEIDSMCFEQTKFIHICSELSLDDLEKKLNDLMAVCYERSKKQLKNAIKVRNVKKSYQPGFNKEAYVDSIFLSKKI